MREIKFRVFDKQKKEMVGVSAINFCEGMFMPDNIDYVDFYNYDSAYYSYLMQYTGLKDKNGVEIYEYMEIDNLFEVSFCDGCYILTNISNKDIIPLNFYIKENNGQVEVTREYTKV